MIRSYPAFISIIREPVKKSRRGDFAKQAEQKTIQLSNIFSQHRVGSYLFRILKSLRRPPFFIDMGSGMQLILSQRYTG